MARGLLATTLAAAIAALGAGTMSDPAAAQSLQISKLGDVGFGAIADVVTDLPQSQSVCVYSGLIGGRYSITATGSGTGGAFTLSNGASLLPYEVQWSTSSGQTSGTNLVAGAAFTGGTMLLSCPVVTSTNSTLTVILRAAAIGAASAGSYGGTLTLIVSPN